ncbi:MAG: NAD(P)-dependent oxidoreductase [Deltaproteobacteria bacterium]|nr:NAD(P)-dependent oxidoreductase [Deltaproteobacteria bacterium]
MTRPILWSNQSMPEATEARLRAGAALFDVILATSGQSEAQIAAADVVYGQPPVAALLEALRSGRGPRLVQLSSAGYTNYSGAELRAAFVKSGAVLCKSSRVYEEPVAQHMLAFMLAWARGLPETVANARGPRAWPTTAIRQRSFLLNRQTVVIVGYGSIGARLVAMCKPFDMRIVGIRQSIRGDEGIEMLTVSDPRVNAMLGQADHVVNLLPAHETTHHYFDAVRLAACKRGSRFYNGGRGVTVAQDALCEALTSGHLSAALLDVTDPEPLPPEHPLWSTPNCVITPHSAGGHGDEHDRLVDHLLANLARLDRGELPDDHVD